MRFKCIFAELMISVCAVLDNFILQPFIKGLRVGHLNINDHISYIKPGFIIWFKIYKIILYLIQKLWNIIVLNIS